MGRKSSMGMQSFGKVRRDGFVYVDKTACIHELVQAGALAPRVRVRAILRESADMTAKT